MKQFYINISALIFLLFVLTCCQEEKINPGVDHSVPAGVVASQESWHSQYLFYGAKGSLTAILYADHLSDYPEKRLMFVTKMKVNFYDSLQNVSTYLVADSGKYDYALERFYAIGNVIAVNDSGTTLKTEQLEWRRVDKKIVTDKFVTVTSKKEDLQGYGFESDEHIRNWTVFKPVINTVFEEKKKK